MNIDQRASGRRHRKIQRALGDFVKSFRQDGGYAQGGVKVQPQRAGEIRARTLPIKRSSANCSPARSTMEGFSSLVMSRNCSMACSSSS
jgi:hypothetical protein